MEVKNAVEPISEEQNLTSYVHFDFYLSNGPQAKLQPHPTKKILFHGAIMPYPLDRHVFDATLEAAFWYKKSDAAVLAAKQGICAFALPEKHMYTDMPDTIENKQVALRCSTALKAHGHESFESVCHQEVAEAAPVAEQVAGAPVAA